MATRNRPAAVLAALLAALSGCDGQRGGPGSRVQAPDGPWPSDRQGLVFLWETDQPGRRSLAFDPAGKSLTALTLAPHRAARRDAHYAMLLQGGWFAAEGAEAHLVSEARRANAFTLECHLRPWRARQDGAIVALADDRGNLNFALAQEGRRLVFRLRTSATGPQGRSWTVGESRPGHLVLAFRPGRLDCYLDDAPARTHDTGPGDLSAWERLPLRFGSGDDDRGGWWGALEGVALYSRALGAAEAGENSGRYRERTGRRSPIPRVELEARLRQRSRVPDPKQMGPYKSALGTYEYEVEKVLAGKCDEKIIRVAHWVIMQTRVLPIAGRQPGARCRLVLEPLAAHPELEREFRSLTLELDAEVERPLFYEVGPVEAPPGK